MLIKEIDGSCTSQDVVQPTSEEVSDTTAELESVQHLESAGFLETTLQYVAALDSLLPCVGTDFSEDDSFTGRDETSDTETGRDSWSSEVDLTEGTWRREAQAILRGEGTPGKGVLTPVEEATESDATSSNDMLNSCQEASGTEANLTSITDGYSSEGSSSDDASQTDDTIKKAPRKAESQMCSEIHETSEMSEVQSESRSEVCSTQEQDDDSTQQKSISNEQENASLINTESSASSQDEETPTVSANVEEQVITDEVDTETDNTEDAEKTVGPINTVGNSQNKTVEHLVENPMNILNMHGSTINIVVPGSTREEVVVPQIIETNFPGSTVAKDIIPGPKKDTESALKATVNPLSVLGSPMDPASALGLIVNSEVSPTLLPAPTEPPSAQQAQIPDPPYAPLFSVAPPAETQNQEDKPLEQQQQQPLPQRVQPPRRPRQTRAQLDAELDDTKNSLLRALNNTIGVVYDTRQEMVLSTCLKMNVSPDTILSDSKKSEKDESKESVKEQKTPEGEEQTSRKTPSTTSNTSSATNKCSQKTVGDLMQWFLENTQKDSSSASVSAIQSQTLSQSLSQSHSHSHSKQEAPSKIPKAKEKNEPISENSQKESSKQTMSIRDQQKSNKEEEGKRPLRHDKRPDKSEKESAPRNENPKKPITKLKPPRQLSQTPKSPEPTPQRNTIRMRASSVREKEVSRTEGPQRAAAKGQQGGVGGKAWSGETRAKAGSTEAKAGSAEAKAEERKGVPHKGRSKTREAPREEKGDAPGRAVRGRRASLHPPAPPQPPPSPPPPKAAPEKGTRRVNRAQVLLHKYAAGEDVKDMLLKTEREAAGIKKYTGPVWMPETSPYEQRLLPTSPSRRRQRNSRSTGRIPASYHK